VRTEIAMRHWVLALHVLALGCGDAGELVSREIARESGIEAGPPNAAPSIAYATRVLSYTKGDKGGFNEDKLPTIVLGQPHGGGCCAGSLDVLSLGDGGEIVLGFDVTIVDGPGVDFVVFENPFEPGGDPTAVLAEPAEVAVSEDGESWTTFPCTTMSYPYGSCAGWHPVYATPENPIDPGDPSKAGGDPFDLSTTGVSRARFVRIRDMNRRFPAASPTAGFDLDAVAVVHFQP
jgi:hypothetical protein